MPLTPIEIVYLDEHIVVAVKPPNMLIHRSDYARQHTDPKQFMMQRLRWQLGQAVYPVHRLDRPTSGMVVMGLCKDTQRHLSLQFENREVDKTYHAIVRGWPIPQGDIDRDLFDEDRGVLPSQTAYKVVEAYELPVARPPHLRSRFSLVELYPHTGRKHQLRRHLKGIAHPIIGDTTHGDREHNRWFATRVKMRRMLLFASSLRFNHPVRGKKMIVNHDGVKAYQQFMRRQALNIYMPTQQDSASARRADAYILQSEDNNK